MTENKVKSQSVLGEMPPAKAIIKLALPATLALLAKAVYNLVDTAYIGMLSSDIALTAVGVTVPLLLIMVSIEIFLRQVLPFLPGGSWVRKMARPQAALSRLLSAFPSALVCCSASAALFSLSR